MKYKLWYLFYRVGFYLRQPYIPGKRWRYRLYRIRGYLLYSLPLDIQIARQFAILFVRGQWAQR